MQEIDWLRSIEDDMTLPTDIIPPPPQFTDWVTDSHGYGGCSSGAESNACGHGGVSVSCYSCGDVSNDCICRLQDVSVSEHRYGLQSGSESSGGGHNRGLSDSDCSLELVGVSASICTHESKSDSSCYSIGDGSDSMCSLKNVSDCLSSVCVSDNFLGEGGMSDATWDLMGVSGFESSPCRMETDFGLASSVEGVSASSSSYQGLSEGPAQNLVGISESSCTPAVASTSPLTSGDVPDNESMVGALRGKVTQIQKYNVSPFFKDLVKHTSNERKADVPVNEGIIFHNVRIHICQLLLVCDIYQYLTL